MGIAPALLCWVQLALSLTFLTMLLFHRLILKGIWTLARKMTSFRFPEKVVCFRVRVRVTVRIRFRIRIRVRVRVRVDVRVKIRIYV